MEKKALRWDALIVKTAVRVQWCSYFTHAQRREMWRTLTVLYAVSMLFVHQCISWGWGKVIQLHGKGLWLWFVINANWWIQASLFHVTNSCADQMCTQNALSTLVKGLHRAVHPCKLPSDSLNEKKVSCFHSTRLSWLPMFCATELTNS